MSRRSRKRKSRRITPELRREVMRLAAKGLSYRQILARVDTSRGSVGIMLRPLGGVASRDMLEPTGKRLSLEDRVVPKNRIGISPHASKLKSVKLAFFTNNAPAINDGPAVVHEYHQT